ncbi:MAG TPA: polysaccharide deacetylase family protein [Sphingomicrobium sp.]|nr:polysaccharide deacetylase family protein [Sphingomicrobium sp.]
MFHRVAVESFDPWGLAVNPDVFARQLDWLKRHRRVMRLTEFAQLCRQGTLPREAVAITFDDGYACFAERAAPLLERANLPATVFLPVQLMKQESEFWWDELQEIVLSHEAKLLRLEDIQFELGCRRDDDMAWRPGAAPATARQQAFWSLFSRLKHSPHLDREAAMAALRQQAGRREHIRASHRPMRADEIEAVRSRNVEFGSHGLTHASLPALPSAAKADEIANSVGQCEALTGERPRTYAYAFGDHDAEAEALVEAAGFCCACTTEQRTVGSSERLFALPRVHVGNWTPGRLKQVVGAA